MIINLNINEISQPVIKEVKKSSFIKRFLIKWLEGLYKKSVSRLISVIDNAILKTEGTHKHLKSLSPDSAGKILQEIKDTITELNKFYYRLDKSNFYDNKELELKYRYLLKSVYRSEAITHKIAYRDQKTLKTDKSIKDGIIKMNSEILKRSIS